MTKVKECVGKMFVLVWRIPTLIEARFCMTGDGRIGHEDCAVHVAAPQFASWRSDIENDISLFHYTFINDSLRAVCGDLAPHGLGERQIAQERVHEGYPIGPQISNSP